MRSKFPIGLSLAILTFSASSQAARVKFTKYSAPARVRETASVPASKFEFSTKLSDKTSYTLRIEVSADSIRVSRTDLLGEDHRDYKILSSSELEGVGIPEPCTGGKAAYYAGERVKGNEYDLLEGISIRVGEDGNARVCVTYQAAASVGETARVFTATPVQN